MPEFIRYVLWELQNSFGLVLLAGAAAVAVLAVVYFIHRRKYKGEKKYPWVKALLWLVFAGYMAIVIYATMLRGFGFFHREWNFHLFRAWREAWNNFSAKNWANVLLNVAMFVPLGFLLPLLGKKFRKWYLTISAGFSASLGIELLQLAIGIGICDVDDLFANTLGTVIGYFLVMTVLAMFAEKGKRLRSGITYGCLFLVFVMSVCSIFLAYALKEYGNLPMAAAYTNDVSGVEWSLDCVLPEEDETLPVYQTQTRSVAQCDAFAEDFKKIINTEYNTVSYYQEAAYYMDNGSEGGAHFLHVNYLDQGYEYSASYHDDIPWVDADRQVIEEALSGFPVLIPESAEFNTEGEGWHSFTVCRQEADGVLVDGILRVRYAEDGSIRRIENKLLQYSYYDSVPMISPQAAYERLCAGKFYDGGYFEHKKPAAVSVLGCALGYEIDTKGFYQPVYYFDVASVDGNYRARIMIPAME